MGRIVVILLLLLALVAPAAAAPKKKLLLVGQAPDGVHPKGTHEYAPAMQVLSACLEKVPELELTSVRADGAWKEGPELLGRSDGVVLFVAEGARWLQAEPERHKAFQQLAARGGGIVALHWALGTREAGAIPSFVKLVGGCHGGPDRKFKVIETDVVVMPHAVTAGLKNFAVKDEFYYRLKFVEPRKSLEPLLQVTIEGKKETVAWAWQRPDGGRSAGFSGLHFHSNWKLLEYRRLAAQAALWSLKLPVPKEGLDVAIREEDLRLK